MLRAHFAASLASNQAVLASSCSLRRTRRGGLSSSTVDSQSWDSRGCTRLHFVQSRTRACINAYLGRSTWTHATHQLLYTENLDLHACTGVYLIMIGIPHMYVSAYIYICIHDMSICICMYTQKLLFIYTRTDKHSSIDANIHTYIHLYTHSATATDHVYACITPEYLLT
jgi:hypothetical protein